MDTLDLEDARRREKAALLEDAEICLDDAVDALAKYLRGKSPTSVGNSVIITMLGQLASIMLALREINANGNIGGSAREPPESGDDGLSGSGKNDTGPKSE